MRKKIIRGAMRALFPILFNTIFFLFGGVDHPASVWLSYAWIHVAYLLVLSVPLFTRKTQSMEIFHFTTGQITSAYFALEFVLGLIFIFIRAESFKVPFIIQFIPFCTFLALFLWMTLFNERTADSEQKRAIEISFIKTAASKAKILMDSVDDPNLKNKLEKTYDLIHSSPTKSYPSVKELENNAMYLLNEVSDLISEGNNEEAIKLIRKIQFSMEERNRIVGLSN